jgi:predicted AAA+ superfamily ATPase
VQERLYREFKKKEKQIYVEDDEEEVDVIAEPHPVDEVKQEVQMSVKAQAFVPKSKRQQ